MKIRPNGAEICTNGKCTSAAGKTVGNMLSNCSGISVPKVAEAARLPGVAAAAGGITLQDSSMTFPKSGGGLPQTSSYTVDGVDIGHAALGPLSSASLTSGHSFTAAESDSYVAIVDSGYATSHSLKAGSAISIDNARYTVIGVVSQPAASSPPDVYVPLARAQAMPVGPAKHSLKNEVNTVYLTAASAADIPAVSKEIAKLLPGATVTTASGLASSVTGSLSSAASLANDLGRRLSVLVLIAAIAPELHATVPASNPNSGEVIGTPGQRVSVGTIQAHSVPVLLHPSVTAGVIVLAVILAVAGGLLAGAFGSWRIARLRPAGALAQVA